MVSRPLARTRKQQFRENALQKQLTAGPASPYNHIRWPDQGGSIHIANHGGGQMAQAKVGVIGGSGLYQMEGLTDIGEVNIETPFGAPSDSFTVGSLDGIRVAFLP